jgi:hypothetical protein
MVTDSQAGESYVRPKDSLRSDLDLTLDDGTELDESERIKEDPDGFTVLRIGLSDHV